MSLHERTCRTNSSHEEDWGTSRRDLSQKFKPVWILVPVTRFNCTNGNLLQGLVAETSPLVCAVVYVGVDTQKERKTLNKEDSEARFLVLLFAFVCVCVRVCVCESKRLFVLLSRSSKSIQWTFGSTQPSFAPGPYQMFEFLGLELAGRQVLSAMILRYASSCLPKLFTFCPSVVETCSLQPWRCAASDFRWLWR